LFRFPFQVLFFAIHQRMTTPFKGSKPGPITRTTSYKSIIAQWTAHINDEYRGSFSTLNSETSTESEFPGKAWMEKDYISAQDFPAEHDSTTTKDGIQSHSLQPSGSTHPPLNLVASLPWQAGPPASIHSAGYETTYPEGGLRAWLVVFGSFCGMLAGFGFMNTSEQTPYGKVMDSY
jgi:hypothetical protein